MLKNLDFFSQIALILVLVGGILWGIVGLFNVYLLTGIIGRLICLAVGVAAGWLSYKIYLEKFKK